MQNPKGVKLIPQAKNGTLLQSLLSHSLCS